MRIRVALGVLAILMPVCGHASPPAGRWTLTFEDNFSGQALDKTTWAAEDIPVGGAASVVRSSRSSANVIVADGLCRLVTTLGKTDENSSWVTASMYTRSFHQQYGYFEARIRYGKASGLNNGFWLDAWDGSKTHFEIDINEGHYPDAMNMTIHNWKPIHQQRGTRAHVHQDLTTAFHVYGLLWTSSEIVWYLDGSEVHREEARDVRGEMKVCFSTAVLEWAGKITDRLLGTEMDVDWVRVYAPVAEP